MDCKQKIENNSEVTEVKKEPEAGRSMVEMLGVLAIIGVLSVGGIYGYTYGMNRYRTNEIVDAGTKRAYTVATQLSVGINPDLSEFSEQNEVAGGTFSNTVKTWEGEFGFAITGVTKPVCENLIQMASDATPLRAITKTSAERTDLLKGSCANTNDLYLVYSIEGISGDASGDVYTIPAVTRPPVSPVGPATPESTTDYWWGGYTATPEYTTEYWRVTPPVSPVGPATPAYTTEYWRGGYTATPEYTTGRAASAGTPGVDQQQTARLPAAVRTTDAWWGGYTAAPATPEYTREPSGTRAWWEYTTGRAEVRTTAGWGR